MTGHKWFGLISAVMILVMAGAASAVALPTVGVFGTKNNVSDGVVGASSTLADFKTAVGAAYDNDLGGVVDLETLGHNIPLYPVSTVTYGTNGLNSFDMNIDSSNPRGWQAYTTLTYWTPSSGIVAVLTRDTASAASVSTTFDNFTQANVGIVELGMAVLSNSYTQQTIGIEAHFSVSPSEIISAQLAKASGSNLFYSIAAPAGETITGFTATVDPVATFAGNRMGIDDLSFILAAPAAANELPTLDLFTATYNPTQDLLVDSLLEVEQGALVTFNFEIADTNTGDTLTAEFDVDGDGNPDYTATPGTGGSLVGSFDFTYDTAGAFAITVDYGDGVGDAQSFTGSSVQVSEIPEPATMSLLGIGVLGLIARRKRR